jgi:hypothetical protein
MQARMLKLQTRTQSTQTFIATAWRAPLSTLECVTVLKNAQKWKKMCLFSAASAFLPHNVFDKMMLCK